MPTSPSDKSLKEWLTTFEALTEKVRELTRSLSFAGIALIWIFKNGNSDKNLPSTDLIPNDLERAAYFICICLALDIFSYVFKAVGVFLFWFPKEQAYGRQQLSAADANKVKAPYYITIVSWIIFIAMLVFLTIAYTNIMVFIKARI